MRAEYAALSMRQNKRATDCRPFIVLVILIFKLLKQFNVFEKAAMADNHAADQQSDDSERNDQSQDQISLCIWHILDSFFSILLVQNLGLHGIDALDQILQPNTMPNQCHRDKRAPDRRVDADGEFHAFAKLKRTF